MAIILTAHIAIAISTLILSVTGLLAGSRLASITMPLGLTLGTTIVSGVVLAVSSPVSVLSVCDNLALYAAVTGLALVRVNGLNHRIYKPLSYSLPGVMLAVIGVALGL